jgi:two-component system sensor histidine kinase KdpD
MSQARNSLRPAELEAVYAISRAVIETLDIDKALAEIVRLSRPVFIFDNAVLYLANESGDALEPAFARAIGRGRSSEADSAWGEAAAYEAFEKGRNIVRQPSPAPDQDRLEQRFFLAMPLTLGRKAIGALVFIRFGGPTFAEDQINLAEYIAAHVSQVLEHKRLVERIGSLEAERRLSQLQSDFIATVSHELKTPLGFIKGYSTTLLRKDTEWTVEEQHEFLDIIDEETDHLVELVDNLLDSSRLQAGTMGIVLKPIDLAAVLEENIERLRVRFPASTIRWKFVGKNASIEADARRLGQVIDNLVSNAVKYGGNGPLTVTLTDEIDQISISVKDSGPGVPADYQDLIFNRFYRIPGAREKARGSGLGLYICQQIVLAHGGQIGLAPAAKGAEFVIRLPRKTAPETVLQETV